MRGEGAFRRNFLRRKANLCGRPMMIEAAICALTHGQPFERGLNTEKFLVSVDRMALAKIC
jgi:hypothetical protein